MTTARRDRYLTGYAEEVAHGINDAAYRGELAEWLDEQLEWDEDEVLVTYGGPTVVADLKAGVVRATTHDGGYGSARIDDAANAALTELCRL